MDALRTMTRATRPGGAILDLQVIRPNPRVEHGGRVLCEIDGEALFRWADAAVAALDARVAAGDLADEAIDDHDVLKHFDDGDDLVDDWSSRDRRVPEWALPAVRAIAEPLVTRERCRLRRLRRLR